MFRILVLRCLIMTLIKKIKKDLSCVLRNHLPERFFLFVGKLLFEIVFFMQTNELVMCVY